MMGRYWTNWLASMVELTTRWRKCTKTFDVRSSLPWVTASTWWVRARGRQAAQWNVNAAVAAAASVPRKGTAATVQTATQDGARLTFSGDSAWPQTPPRQTHVRFRFNLIVKRFWRNYDRYHRSDFPNEPLWFLYKQTEKFVLSTTMCYT